MHVLSYEKIRMHSEALFRRIAEECGFPEEIVLTAINVRKKLEDGKGFKFDSPFIVMSIFLLAIKLI